MEFKSFEDLEVWKECRQLKKSISLVAKKFPPEEKFKLTDQIIRASRSTTANIAEGYGRFHYQENIQFCRQARGSLLETLDHLITSYDEKYLDENELNKFREQYSGCLKLLNGYIAYLKKRKSEE